MDSEGREVGLRAGEKDVDGGCWTGEYAWALAYPFWRVGFKVSIMCATEMVLLKGQWMVVCTTFAATTVTQQDAR